MKLKDDSVYAMLSRVIQNWDRIPIRVKQDGQWQSLFLIEIKSESEKAKAIISWLEKFIKEE